MRVIPFQDCANLDYHLKEIQPHYHFWDTSSSWSTSSVGRVTSGLMCFLNCEAEYYIDGNCVLKALVGDVVYLPQGLIYTCVFKNLEQPSGYKAKSFAGDIQNLYLDGTLAKTSANIIHNAINISFNLYDDQMNPFIFSDSFVRISPSEDNFYVIRKTFDTMVEMSAHGVTRPALLKSSLYRLLTLLSDIIADASIKKGKYAPILKALQYIENNDIRNLFVENLAKGSGISLSSFRNLFKEYTDKTPINYLADIKIEKSKALLKSGVSVKEVAYSIGIDDVGYFSRFFKKHTGYPPSHEYNLK